jgi:glucose/arabinose dehydrogenase
MKHNMLILLAVLVIVVIIGAFVLLRVMNQPAPENKFKYEVEVAFPNLSFERPVGIYSARDGSNRLFVLEQRGVIYVFENSKNVTAASVFLDIRDRVYSVGNEEGLLGLAFHQDFASNGFLYVDYTTSDPLRTVIARYTVATDNHNQADRNSELVLLEVSQPFDNHKGGQLVFGPDGYLYIALGDGGSGGDPLGNGQNRSTPLGKILRIDVDATSGNVNYGIPSDNPFVGNVLGYREEIYAYGLRNPWRFSFDPVTGWLWAGDVGQDRIEEIDIIEKGKNYGWNIVEGNLCFSPAQNCNRTGLEPPIWTYNHTQGEAIVGGFVYRGSEMTELNGYYVYGDFESGRIWALSYDGVNTPVNTELSSTSLNISSFGIDEENELYICAFDGNIYRLIHSPIT